MKAPTLRARVITLLALSNLSAVPSASANWPQWRGPLANGTALNANPPVEWSESKNIKWKAALPGEGSSTPIIWGDRIFLTAAVSTGTKPATPSSAVASEGSGRPPGNPGGGPFNRAEFLKRFDKNNDGQLDDTEREAMRAQFGSQQGKGGPGGRRGGGGGLFGGQKPAESHRFLVLCLDRNTGKIIWEKVAREEVPHEGHHPTGTFAGASPITDGALVFAFFGSRGLHAYDVAGNPKWSKDFGRMTIKNSFGEGSSPALHGNTLVVNWDHESGSFITALDKRTGQELWRQNRDEETGWSTPLIVEHGGKAQVVVNATGKVRSYDLATGKVLWETTGQTANAIPSPVAANGLVYVTSGFRGSALQAIRLGRTGSLNGTDAVAWSHDRDTPYVPSPLLFDGRLYFHKVNSGVLSCFDANTGKPLFAAERLPDNGTIYASPVAARDRLYMVNRNGTTMVVKHSDKLEVLATNKLDDGVDASPAIVGDELFLRGKRHLYCIAAN